MYSTVLVSSIRSTGILDVLSAAAIGDLQASHVPEIDELRDVPGDEFYQELRTMDRPSTDSKNGAKTWRKDKCSQQYRALWSN